MKQYLIVVCFWLLYNIVNAQQNKIVGIVVDENNQPVAHALISVKKESKGISASINGTFEIVVNPPDTLLIYSLGYQLKTKVISTTSTDTLIIVLLKKGIDLKTVSVIAPRSYEEIQDDLKKNKPYQYQVNGLSAVSSPITYLYERFSKFEKSKRTVAELESEDRRREAIKELLAVYISHDIIQLSDNEMNEFIAFCNLSDQFIILSTEYELIFTIKAKFALFKNQF